MAKVYLLNNHEEWEKKPGESWDEHMKRQQKMMSDLQKKAQALPDGTYEGGLLRFGVADGYAVYQVYSLKPLQLCHVPYGDAYHADPILLRGLNATDVKKHIDGEKALAKMFATRAKKVA